MWLSKTWLFLYLYYSLVFGSNKEHSSSSFLLSHSHSAALNYELVTDNIFCSEFIFESKVANRRSSANKLASSSRDLLVVVYRSGQNGNKYQIFD